MFFVVSGFISVKTGCVPEEEGFLASIRWFENDAAGWFYIMESPHPSEISHILLALSWALASSQLFSYIFEGGVK